MTNRTDKLNHVYSYTYDSDDRMTKATNPLGFATKIGYDPNSNVTNRTDALNNTYAYVYDPATRLQKIKDPLGFEINYDYDPNSNLTNRTDALNHSYSYDYDALNRVTVSTFPDGSKEKSSYDSSGNLATFTNRSNQVTLATHDAADRLTVKTWQGPTNTVFSYNYDLLNRPISITRTHGSVIESGITNSFDADSRLIQQQQGDDSIGYGYDAVGSVTNMLYPSGLTVGYSYDARNQLSAISDSVSGPVAQYTRDAVGQIKKRSLQNGTECVYAYDAANRPTDMACRFAANPTNIVQSFSYGYDPVGNRTFVKKKSGRGDVYQYDQTYQVTGVKYNVDDPTVGYTAATNPARVVTYSYDGVGNRTAMVDNGTNTTYTVNNLNQYTAAGSTNPTYDTRGNLTFDGKFTYSYDHENHLIRAAKPGTIVTYSYDGLGRRIRKKVNAKTTEYIYDQRGQIIEERNGADFVLARYIYEAGIDRPVKVMDGVKYYDQQDALGNVTAVLNQNGVIKEQYEYDIFGKVTVKDKNGVIKNSKPISTFLFTGRQFDAETGNYQYRGRDYSPTLGRFLQPDPIGFSGGDINLYRFVSNNPVNLVDPLGLQAEGESDAECEAKCTKQKQDCILQTTRWASSQLAGKNFFSSIGGKFTGIAVGAGLVYFAPGYGKAIGAGLAGASTLAALLDISSVLNAAQARNAVCDQEYKKCMANCKKCPNNN